MPKKQENFDLDAFIKRLRNPPKNVKSIVITSAEILKLCNIAKASFIQQKTLLSIKAPVKICGDVHGQYFDLLKLFTKGGCPSVTAYLFLGDYVDRGENSLETICLLLALKTRYPKTFYLIRGNHELAPINRMFGFFQEVERRFKDENFMKLYLQLNDTFNYMPIAAVIDKKVLCCHGGISPLILTLDTISQIKRPIYPRKTGLATDIFWSDPDDDIEEWEKQDQPETNPKHRGIGYLWGSVAHKDFLKRNKLKLIVRAHECVKDGYRWSFGKQLVTVFSAPDYSEGNVAAIATYSARGVLTFATFK